MPAGRFEIHYSGCVILDSIKKRPPKGGLLEF
ncbi:MAG: hypothetical protein A4E61_01005 [Syntrophorhabdus sp. PtaB.Bin184]|nr:MAG: hypothetical protein A4E61_01005 [Syntrophorhabdus sp. PtaB.Bin184]